MNYLNDIVCWSKRILNWTNYYTEFRAELRAKSWKLQKICQKSMFCWFSVAKQKSNLIQKKAENQTLRYWCLWIRDSVSEAEANKEEQMTLLSSIQENKSWQFSEASV